MPSLLTAKPHNGPAPNLYFSGVKWGPESVLPLLPLIACKNCGKCCNIPHPIRVQGYEAERIAEFLEVPVQDLTAGWERLDITDWSFPSPCPFRSEKGCTIYSARPVVCKYFPLQTLRHEGQDVVGVTIGLCDAGRPCIAQCEEWQR